jgi:hypothetical protein
VRRVALEKSPVIKGWIEDPSSLPSRLRKDDGLHFPNVDVLVVKTVIRYLEGEEEEFEFGNHQRDPVFFVRVYKLSLSLG